MNAGGLGCFQHRVGIGRGDQVAGLVLAEQVRVGVVRAGGVQADADLAGQGDIGRGDKKTAVRQVMDAGDEARADQAAHEIAVLALER